LTKSHKRDREDVDFLTLGRALWHAEGWIVGLALGAGLVTFGALSMDRPVAAASAQPAAASAREPNPSPALAASLASSEGSGDEDNDVGPEKFAGR
jgi:hypothetical protein